MRLLFLLIFLIFSSWTGLATNLYAQKDSLNQLNSKGQKQGKWIYYGKDRPDLKYPPTSKVEEGEYQNGRREGTWIKYYPTNSKPMLIGEYKNNRPAGKYTKFYSNGKVMESGTFEISQYKDSLIRYYENGKVMYIANYNNKGVEEGKVKYFYPNGQLEYEYTVENGVQTGKAQRYYENGDKKEVNNYNKKGELVNSQQIEIKNNPVELTPEVQDREYSLRLINPKVKTGNFQPNGYNKVYNDENEIWQDGDFKGGRLFNGKIYVYDSDGILLKVKVYKNGYYHSDGQL